MAALLQQLTLLSVELRSDKNPIRHKATECLDGLLTNSKANVIALFRSYSGDVNVVYTELFQAAMEATFNHANRLVRAQDAKNLQTMANKNYIFGGNVNKLIEYSLENENNFLTKSIIIAAFMEGMSRSCVVNYFYTMLLNLLERGIYKSPCYVRDLKVNEYSRILSYLFEANANSNQILRFALLRTLIKTIELAVERVQISADIIEYLPEVRVFAQNVEKDDRRRSDVIKLFHLFVTQFSADYHHAICTELQEVLPIICNFHSVYLGVDTKATLFDSIYIALCAIYPHAHQGNFSTLGIILTESWPKTLRCLQTIIEREAKERHVTNSGRAGHNSAVNDKSFALFVRLAAFVTYLYHWHLVPSTNSVDVGDKSESRSKIPKRSDPLEALMTLVHPKENSFNEIWFAIVAQLSAQHPTVVNIANYEQVLLTAYDFLYTCNSVFNLRNSRQCLTTLLDSEKQFVASHSIPAGHYASLWHKLVDFLLAESSTDSDIIAEKNLLLQALIAGEKVTAAQCSALLHTIMSNSTLRRTECVMTMRHMLMHAERCSLDKTQPTTESLIKWLNERNERFDAKNVLLNIAPINAALIADTSAIAVINFLSTHGAMMEKAVTATPAKEHLQLLLYKYNRSYVCLEEHGREMLALTGSPAATSGGGDGQQHNCLFQSNYELLMRLLNFATPNETTTRDELLNDLTPLHKMACQMQALLRYSVFDEANYALCPLIKRIGFFLSHIEFQFKQHKPRDFERSNMFEILQRLEVIFTIFTADPILLNYLETQPLEELTAFLGGALKFSAAQELNSEFDDWKSVTLACMRLLAILSASGPHCSDAFTHIARFNFNTHTHLDSILSLIELFSVQRRRDDEIAHWIIDHLKKIFLLYYTHIEHIARIVKILPSILNYVQHYDAEQQNMLIALASLLKVAYKKSYPLDLTVALIDSIRQIARLCDRFFDLENFTNICCSVVKFLPFPSLCIQYATVNTMAALFDAAWLKGGEPNTLEHFTFSKKLLTHIDWEQMPTTSVDLQQNSTSVTLQTLVAVFVFGSYDQDFALEELSNLCAQRKLSAADLSSFCQIAAYNKCTLDTLMRPHVVQMIHNWSQSGYRIAKFPYFICYKNKADFYAKHLPTIATCVLLYSNVEEFKQLEKNCDSWQTLVDLIQPVALAHLLPAKVQCAEASKYPFIDLKERLVDNLKILNIHVDKARCDWKAIYTCVQLLSDEIDFHYLFEQQIYGSSNIWYNISGASLKQCLAFYSCEAISADKTAASAFAVLIAQFPLYLVHTLNALKEDCLAYRSLVDRMRNFHRYCALADLLVDGLEAASTTPIKSSTAALNYVKYFVRDIIYFMLYFLQSAHSAKLQLLSLTFLRHVIYKFIFAQESCSNVLRSHLNDIVKTLVVIVESTNDECIVELSLSIIEHLVVKRASEFREAIALLDDFPAGNRFAKISVSDSGENDLPSVISAFLHTKSRGIESLKATRRFIAKNKAQLPQHQELLYALIRRLIEIVRQATPAQADLSQEASCFLGEIGSLQIADTFYYFETETSFYADAAIAPVPIEYFVRALYASLDRLLLTFNAATQTKLCEVAHLLVSSTKGKQLIAEYPYFNVFVKHSKSANCLNDCANINPIDWMATLESTKTLVGYDAWIRGFVSKLFANCGWTDFGALAALDAGFADAVLQPFVRLLMPQKEQQLEGLTTMLDYYFGALAKALNGDCTEELSIFKEKRVVQKFLKICECIRIHNEWQVSVNLLHVATACNYCQAYFMSIIYLELWALTEQTRIDAKNNKLRGEITADEQFQESALKAYQSIGCKDAITGFLNPLQSRVDFLNLNNNWADILIEAQTEDVLWDEIFTGIMKRNGMLSLAALSHSTSKAHDYEVYWRLGRWDTLVEGHEKVNTANDMEYEFEKHHFNALKCLHNREKQNCLAAVANARHCIVSILKEISFECLQSVYKYLTWLQLLRQVEDFSQVQFYNDASVGEIFQNWQLETELLYGSFQCKEQVLSHQIALFGTGGVRASRKINDLYKEHPIGHCLLKCIKECKSAGEMNLAKRNIAQLKRMNISNEQMQVSVMLEDAEVCFETGKPQITKAILQEVLQHKAYTYCTERVRACRRLGEYLLESKEESFETVLQRYFNGSIDLLEKYSRSQEEIRQRFPNFTDMKSFADFEQESRKSAYETIAKYADREYTQLNTYAMSNEFKMRCRIIQENRQAAESVGKQNKNRELNIGAAFMKKFANLDEQEVQSIEQKRTDNLCIALENYMHFCRHDAGVSSPAIYRIITLWFANKQNTMLQKKLEEHIKSVPSYKFICALNQMTARLDSKNVAFRNVLKGILVRCAEDHPQQTLYQLYALVYAFNDSSTGQANSNNRVAIAKEIIAKAKNKTNSNCMRQMEAMLPALIEFANLEVSDKLNKDATIKLSEKLTRLRNLTSVQCPTIELPVAPNVLYNITGIVKWEIEAQLVGGINAPKKIKCLCTDGRTRSQLLKSKDDLRQDAVMQQVFTMINGLLRSEPEAIERKLILRTYKVVPLSMRSGILEWCDNTLPIGVYLAGDGKAGAHKKYHPDDYTCSKSRQLSLQMLKEDIDKRYQIYLHICSKLRPVFHYFLLEKFLVPGIWFERRLAYTNSVATTSIVGYILGLGDRHTQNILIDEHTAEVVHIDFGIAFEQGKIMPTPETVPFRLTRDMVAPMGVCGTNGVFKRSCEATMRILRRNQSIIITILEVLLYDPLYLWKVVQQVDTSDEANATEEKNLTAQRALLCVQNKLEGKQAGILGTSAVDVQVQRLINDAISSRNLCQLYPGWDPYM